MNNYEFCSNWALNQFHNEKIRVLDYGCGSGTVVELLRNKKVDAYGCDIFYEGGDYSNFVNNNFISDGIIRKMEGGIIPFGDKSFDFIINNQVMEHVHDLDQVLGEIHRTLKPGGSVLSVFPDKGVWREGHSGIPFLHWFDKKSKIRFYYTVVLRSFGLGYHKDKKSILEWSRDFCEWIDDWTYYRKSKDIYACYGKYFNQLEHIELDWFDCRFSDKYSASRFFPNFFKKLIARKFGGLVFVARNEI